MFTDASRVQGKYDEMALLSAESSTASEGDLIRAMQKKAAAIGANGVILSFNAVAAVADKPTLAGEKVARATAIYIHPSSQ